MIDIRLVREEPDKVKQGAANKNEKCDVDLVLKLDEKRRNILHKVEALKAERNQVSGEIARLKKEGKPADEIIANMRKVGEQISVLDDDCRDVDAQLHDLLSRIPNLPHESAPIGGEENNVVVREWGERPKHTFTPKPHWEIGEALGILDLKGAANISGSGFYVLRGAGAKLHRALINYMLDVHTDDGFEELHVPYLVTAETMFGTGQLPKMAEDMYQLEADGLYLIPTAEVPVTNLFGKQIINEDDLPVSLVAHSPCFRREAGAAGKDTRGMLRVHQFDKVEMVKVVHPDESYKALEELVAQAEKILQGLELHYRVSELASGDLSFASAKCYDLELWAAGVDKYLEISSVSNFEDFQARRMGLRYRTREKKTVFPHTLNGSGVALARLIPAILENYQNEDGTVTVPKVLVPYMHGVEKIGA